MKSLNTIGLLLLACIPTGFAQGSALLSAIESLPTCAISCLTTAVEESPCELTDQRCICMDSELQLTVEACVLTSCSIKEGLVTKNVTQTTCNAPVRDKVMDLRVVNTTLGVISAACVLLRVIYKAVFSLAELGWDDYFVLSTLISGVPSTIITDRGTTANGLGRDIWTLEPGQITSFVRWLYVMEILYFLQITLLKLALLFFFLRIFPGRPVRRVTWATIAFNILFGIAFVIAGIFQCQPISFYWTNWDGEHAGKCININALGWSNAAISIALDVWMLAIPLSQVIYLKLAWKKKIGVTLMFCVGTFVTVVSILRLQSLVHFATSINATWEQWDVVLWSTVEINVGIICACMPAIRVVLVRLFPGVLGSSYASSNQYYAKYGSRSRGGGASKAGNSSNIMGSHPGGSMVNRNPSAREITYTKTFEVQHTDRDNDEVQLVEMDYLSGRKNSRGSDVSMPRSAGSK